MASAKRDLSFDSFLIDAGNRRAHELCLAVAQAEPISPLPVVLVGEPGSGKTHLLHAIANRLRASAGHASILFVSPSTWSAEIERIIADPAPIDMARYAVLLVDDLHAFGQKYESLTQLFEIFLENDHPVVVATDAHPDRLAAMPVKLRRRIRGGQTVSIAAGEARRSLAAIEERLREEQHDAIARLELRLHEMEAEGPGAAVARKQARAAELDLAWREATEARAELEHVRAELALVKVSAKEAAQARARVQELEQQLLERTRQPAPEVEVQAPIKRKLDEARFDAQKAREEARGMLQRAQHLVEVLQQSRVTFEDAKRERERQRGEIEKLNAVFSGEKSGVADADAPAAPESPQPAAGIQEENSALQDEIHRLQESLVRARSDRDTLKSHLARIREELDETRRDLERTRAETLRERTEREEHVREVQEALVAKDAEAESLRSAQQGLLDEIDGLRMQVAEGSGVIERLTTLLGGSPEEDGAANESPEPGDSEDAAGDQPVVRADFGEGLRAAPQKKTGGVHHVEELRSAAGPAFPQGLPPLDDADDEYFRGAARTA